MKKYLKAKRRIIKTQIFSPCKNIIFKTKPSKIKETKILHGIITLQLISSFNTNQNIIFLNPKPNKVNKCMQFVGYPRPLVLDEEEPLVLDEEEDQLDPKVSLIYT